MSTGWRSSSEDNPSDWNLWPPNQTVAKGTKNLTEAGYISVSRTGLWSSASSRRSDHLSIYHLFITISRADPTALLRNEKANKFYAGFVLVWPRVYLVSSSFLNRRASFVLSTMSSLKNHHRKSNINTIPTAVMKPPIICIILLPGLIILSVCPSQSFTSVSVVGWRGHQRARTNPCQHWQGLKKIRDPPTSAPGRQDTTSIFQNLWKHPLNHSTILFIPSTYTNISLWRSRVREWKYTRKHPLFEEGMRWSGEGQGEVGKRVASVWKEGVE